MRRPPRQTPRIGSIEALGTYFDSIAEETRHRARLRLDAERASPQRQEAELAKLEEWLLRWRARSPGAVGSISRQPRRT